MSNEEFRERIKAICGARPPEEKLCVRTPEDEGYHPPAVKARQRVLRSGKDVES
jgi:hypothetical protein